MSDRSRIARDLEALGLEPGSTVMVHSSLSSLGHVMGGAETVIHALRDVLGPEGTLLLPALSYERVTARTPVFDVRTTPSNVGRIPEVFRVWPGVRRSVHPTHSVCALGPRAEELLEGHELDHTPCGEHSAFRRNALTAGHILFLGCGMGPDTTMHAVEEEARSPYLFGDDVVYTVTGWDGVARAVKHRRHGFPGYRQRYDRAEPLLDAQTLRRGSVMAATAHLVRADRLWATALATMARDPYFFVEPAPP